MLQNVGRFTVLCRSIGTAMIAAPLLYWWSFGHQGDALVLLVLALISALAGLVLFANSIYCLRHARNRGQRLTSLLFLLGSVIGVFAMPYVLPGWRM